MFEFLRLLGRFLTRMDARAVTSLLVSAVLLAFVGLMFLFGRDWLAVADEAALQSIMMSAYASPWAVLVVISVFVLLALTGFPQILLISATILAFGALNGAVYSWIATMVSATITFLLGRLFGGAWVVRFGGERVQRTIAFLGRRGLLASGLVRVVPSAPFIVVNAAAGAARIPLWKYWVGSGVGIVPKIAVVAALGAIAPDEAVLQDGVPGLMAFFSSRDPLHIAAVGGIVVGWLGFLLAVRALYIRMRRREDEHF